MCVCVCILKIILVPVSGIKSILIRVGRGGPNEPAEETFHLYFLGLRGFVMERASRLREFQPFSTSFKTTIIIYIYI